MINPSSQTLKPVTFKATLPGPTSVLPVTTADNLPADAVQLSSTTAPAPTISEQPVVFRQPTGEMALMLESMQEAQQRAEVVGNDLEKAVRADLQANGRVVFAPATLLDEQSVMSIQHNPSIDGFLTQYLPPPDSMSVVRGQLEHGHAHTESKENHGLLGSHIGIEGVEHIAHEVLQAKSDIVHAVHSSTDAVDMAVSGGHVVAKTTQAAVTEHGAEAAGHAVTGFMAGLTGALAGASGLLGAVMLAVGFKDVKHGIKHKDTEHVVEGTNNLIVGTRSLAAGTAMAGHLIHGSEVISTVAGIAKSTLTPLGLIHGAVDAGLGTKQVVDGIKSKDSSKITKGSLGIGLGVSLMAVAVGGGVPALVAAGVFLGGKVVHGIHTHKAAQKEAVKPEHS